MEEARKAIASAHVEAKSTTNGVGLVILMGYVSKAKSTKQQNQNIYKNKMLIINVDETVDLLPWKQRLRVARSTSVSSLKSPLKWVWLSFVLSQYFIISVFLLILI